jgi:hypothetical protein
MFSFLKVKNILIAIFLFFNGGVNLISQPKMALTDALIFNQPFEKAKDK